MLTVNLRTHYAIIRSGKEERKIPITTEQYNNLVIAKQDMKSTELIRICDADTQEQLYHGEISSLKEFEAMHRQNLKYDSFVCDYGNKHPLQGECDCFKKYGITAYKYKQDKENKVVKPSQYID